MAKAKRAIKPEQPAEEIKPEEITHDVVVKDVTETPVEKVEEKTHDTPHEEKVAEVKPEEPAPMPQPTTISLQPQNSMVLTQEEKIVAFLESRNGGYVKMNDFLKSIFPLQKFNEPPLWKSQGAMKGLRALLDMMQADGRIKLQNSAYLLLGSCYYPDSATMKTEIHNLDSVAIMASL